MVKGFTKKLGSGASSLIQKGASGIQSLNTFTNNNPLASAGKTIGTRLLQANAPNVVSLYNTITNSYNSMMGNLGVMGNYFSQGTTAASNDVLERMAQINWARGYQWDVYIEPAPEGDFEPKSYGLPVFDIKETCAAVGDSYNLNAANTDYQFPLRKKLFDIQLTMFDNETCDMEQYFEAWINQVYPWDAEGGYTQYLSESVRTLYIRKLDSMKKIIFERQYLVYPEIQLTGINNSESAIRTLTIPLVVAGFLGKRNDFQNENKETKVGADGNPITTIKGHIEGIRTGKESVGDVLKGGVDALKSSTQGLTAKEVAKKAMKSAWNFAKSEPVQKTVANKLVSTVKRF